MEDNHSTPDHPGRNPHILDLPDELLLDIFDYFRADPVDVTDTPYSYLFEPEMRDAGDAELAALQSARLVCRRFHDLASPLLVPVLRVSIDSESLRRVDGLSRNPHIASGVRLIQLLLGYRPMLVAQSFSRYRALQSERIRDLRTKIDRYLEFPDPFDDFSQKMQAAVETYSTMLSEWEECSSDDDTSDKSPFQLLLHQSYAEYRRLQEDQDRVLGSFATALAASATRMPGLRALSFSDHMYRPTQDLSRVALARPALDVNKLRDMMIMPHDWATIERPGPREGLFQSHRPARLLWEVPITLFEAGVRLQEVSVSTMPLLSNTEMLCPRDGAGEPEWGRLRAAFGELRRADVGRLWLNHRNPPRPGFYVAHEDAHTDGYLCALMAGEKLQRMDLDGEGVRLAREIEGIARELELDSHTTGHHAIGEVLAAARHPEMRELAVENVSFLQGEMEAFIGGLGDRLRSVAFYYVEIRDGTWEKPLELLREKIAQSGRDVDVALVGLKGLGMDFSEFDSEDELYSEDEESDGEDSLFNRMQRYARGEEGMANPLSRG